LGSTTEYYASAFIEYIQAAAKNKNQPFFGYMPAIIRIILNSPHRKMSESPKLMVEDPTRTETLSCKWTLLSVAS